MALFDYPPLIRESLQLQTDLQELTKVLQWFEQFNLPTVPDELWMNCQIVLTEGFTNAIRHAHRNLPQTTPIDIEVILFANSLEMRIWDFGQPFDLQAKLQSILEQPPGIEDTGGRGLLWMHQLTDKLCYIRQPDERNCLVLIKNIL